jgi:lysophospholipase L1-like esterase
MLTIGANDALGLRSRAAFSRDVRSIVLTLRAEHPRAVILVSLMPRFDLFDLLPSTLAAHAMNLDDGARSAVSGLDRVIPIRPTPGYSPGFFASDRFHPGPDGYRMWADFVLDETGTLDLDG